MITKIVIGDARPGEVLVSGDGEERYAQVFLRGARDVPLCAVHEPAWLNHFAIEDLLLRGELDDWIGDPSNGRPE